jgi:hypothetical protein
LQSGHLRDHHDRHDPDLHGHVHGFRIHRDHVRLERKLK